MSKYNQFILALTTLLLVISCSEKSKFETKTATSNGFAYEYVTNDPLKARIYTLQNGLKVYLSSYNIAPRVQTQIAVKAGGKNDPANNTGLAHYLEHIMFKGTADFGTLNWTKESVLLDSIEHMYTAYSKIIEIDLKQLQPSTTRSTKTTEQTVCFYSIVQ